MKEKIINPDLDSINDVISPRRIRKGTSAFLNASGMSLPGGGSGHTVSTTTPVGPPTTGGGGLAGRGSGINTATAGTAPNLGVNVLNTAVNATSANTGAVVGPGSPPPPPPPPPPANPPSGTLISSACVGMNTVGTYANGSGGTYTAVITANDPACGYVAPPPPPSYPPSGTLISTACVGMNTVGTYANGSGGTYTGIITANDPACGYVAPSTTTTTVAPAPVVLPPAMSGGGSMDTPLPSGGGAPAAAGPATLVSTYCNGPDQWGQYSDGTTSLIQSGSASCAVAAAPATPAVTDSVNWPLVLGAFGILGVSFYLLRDKKAA